MFLVPKTGASSDCGLRELRVRKRTSCGIQYQRRDHYLIVMDELHELFHASILPHPAAGRKGAEKLFHFFSFSS
jgi:hypothetical protein